jgi:hypothetical protein
MALTVTTIKKPEVIASGRKVATYAVAFDSSYPTGGEAWDLSADFDYIHGMHHGVAKDIDNTTHWFCFFGTLVAGKGQLASSAKLGAIVSATGVQAANAADLSGIDEIIITVYGE